MNDDKMLMKQDGPNMPMLTGEQVLTVLGNLEGLMRMMTQTVAEMNKRIDRLDRQVQQMTPITGAQERALGEKIKQRADELCVLHKLPEGSRTAIANAIRKDIKTTGGVRSIRELPRVDYTVYIDQIALWDDFAVMRAIRKKAKPCI